MTDSLLPSFGDRPPLEEAAERLDAALARLETGMAGLSRKVAEPPAPNDAAPVGDSAREAALEAALREASETIGGLIGEVRSAIAAAEAASAEAGDAAPETGESEQDGDGQG